MIFTFFILLKYLILLLNIENCLEKKYIIFSNKNSPFLSAIFFKVLYCKLEEQIGFSTIILKPEFKINFDVEKCSLGGVELKKT